MSITEEDKQKFLTWWNKVGEEVIGRDGVKEDELQQFFEKRDKLESCIITEIQKSLVKYPYPNDYKVKSIAEQVKILQELFPGIGFADEIIADQLLPHRAEGWFAIPRWQMFATRYYNEAVDRVLSMIASSRPFYNALKDRSGDWYLQTRDEHTKNVWKKLEEKQKDGDIMVIPAQFGLYHDGGNFAAHEVGLGVFAAGIMLLTHPERLAGIKGEGVVYCAGDAYRSHGELRYSESRKEHDMIFSYRVPHFFFRNDQVVFDIGTREIYENSRAYRNGFNATSAFLVE